MPASTGPNLGLKYGWSDRESGYGTDLNADLKRLDALTQLSVKDKDAATPPGSPADGDRYIVAASPTGAWTGHATHVAVWDAAASAWTFYTPKKGWFAYVEDEDKFYKFTTAWTITAA